MQHQYFLPICWHGNHVFFIPPDLHIVLVVKDKGWIGRFDSVVISIFSTIISKRQNILGYCLKTTLLKEKLAHATGVHERKTVPSNVHTISQLREGTVFVPKHRKKSAWAQIRNTLRTVKARYKYCQGTFRGHCLENVCNLTWEKEQNSVRITKITQIKHNTIQSGV